jgi:hypothetical protein
MNERHQPDTMLCDRHDDRRIKASGGVAAVCSMAQQPGGWSSSTTNQCICREGCSLARSVSDDIRSIEPESRHPRRLIDIGPLDNERLSYNANVTLWPRFCRFTSGSFERCCSIA